ncbi:Homeobox protein Hox-D9b [Liparis tanakae]|uniref:Homeobox protein Hox-D9b n=1 Tax=Liparis tanakae TaxID=230148 RepID=A0A4Z2EHX4_9TELE|nr:Homeobox protein Hox-D9b [Liparis tanakae]
MGLQSEEPYGAHCPPPPAAGCTKPARRAEQEQEVEEEVQEEERSAHIPDFSHFSHKQTALNGFSPWADSSSSPLQGASIPGLFHPHHPLLSHQQQHHPYYAEHLPPVDSGRFVRCWEAATPAAAPEPARSHPAPGDRDLSAPSPRYEAGKPGSPPPPRPPAPPPPRDSPGDSSFSSPAEVVLERLQPAQDPGRRPEPKKESEERKTKFDPGKETRAGCLGNVY